MADIEIDDAPLGYFAVSGIISVFGALLTFTTVVTLFLHLIVNSPIIIEARRRQWCLRPRADASAALLMLQDGAVLLTDPLTVYLTGAALFAFLGVTYMRFFYVFNILDVGRHVTILKVGDGVWTTRLVTACLCTAMCVLDKLCEVRCAGHVNRRICWPPSSDASNSC